MSVQPGDFLMSFHKNRLEKVDFIRSEGINIPRF